MKQKTKVRYDWTGVNNWMGKKPKVPKSQREVIDKSDMKKLKKVLEEI